MDHGTLPLNGTLNPQLMQRWDRFDIVIKIAYARHFLSTAGAVPPMPFAVAAYLEHIRIFNGFIERCMKTKSIFFKAEKMAHPNCKVKVGASTFVDSFNALLLSMRASGYRDGNASIPVCHAPAAYPINGAHRIAAATAIGLPSVPVNVMSDCPRPLNPFDWRFFNAHGYLSAFSDWAVHEAIVAESGLHVLHIWPRAVAAGGESDLTKVRSITADRSAVDGGIFYEKRVPISEAALRAYLDMAYGSVPWLQPNNFFSHNNSLPSQV